MANPLIEQTRRKAQELAPRIKHVKDAYHQLRQAGFEDPDIARRIRKLEMQNQTLKEMKL